SAEEALRLIAAHDYDAIVSDIKMPGMDGLALLDEVREIRPETPTLLITGHGEHDLTVRALRGGAYDFIQKPIDREYFVASRGREGRVRGDGLARAAYPAQLDLRRGEDAAAQGPPDRQREPGPADLDDRRRGRPARASRQRDPAREPARLGRRRAERQGHGRR